MPMKKKASKQPSSDRQKQIPKIQFVINGKRYTSDREPIGGEQYFIIESRREVNVALTREDMERLQQYGWRMVLDCSDDDWATVTKKAIDYASKHGMKSRVGPPITKEGWDRMWNNAISILLGDELSRALLMATDMSESFSYLLYREAIRMRGGLPSSLDESEEESEEGAIKYPARDWYSKMRKAQYSLLTDEEKQSLQEWMKGANNDGKIGIDGWPGWEKHIGLPPKSKEVDSRKSFSDVFFNEDGTDD